MFELIFPIDDAMAGQYLSSNFLAFSGSDEPLIAISGMVIIKANITIARKAMVVEDWEDCMSYKTFLFGQIGSSLNRDKIGAANNTAFG